MGFLLQLVVNAAALWVATRLVPGVSYQGGPLPFLAVALMFGIINTTLRPITKLLTCPLILVTLGLFALVVNGLMLLLVSAIPLLGFRVDGLLTAIIGAIVIGLVSFVVSRVIPH